MLCGNMAAYRMAVQVLSRARGASAVAGAAYRRGERLYDERLGVEHDYSGRGGVEYREVMLPASAPIEYANSETLWNAVEQVEKRKDAQLAREFQLNIPHELNPEERASLVRAFLSRRVAEGMIADFAIHRPSRGGDSRNYHAHVMVTLREVDSEGFGLKVTDWNDRSELVRWREEWARDCNHFLEIAGLSTRVTHLSYAARGIDREPEPKLGSYATFLERMGVVTNAGEDRRAVWERNAQRELDRALGVVLHEAAVTQTPHDPNVSVSGSETVKQSARDRLLQQRYGVSALDMGLQDGWKVMRRWMGGIEFAAGERRVSDRGDHLFGKAGDQAEITAMLAICEAKGWTKLQFDGSEEFKFAAMKAAAARGFKVEATGKDKGLAEKALREARSVLVERERSNADPAGPGEPSPARAQIAPRDPALIVEQVLSTMTYSEAQFTQRELDRALTKYAADHPGVSAEELIQAAQTSPDIIKVGERFGVAFYTTEAVRQAERETFDVVQSLQADKSFPTDKEFGAKIAAERGIDGGQLLALDRITAPERAVAVIGFAGTGKSYMLGGAREIWERAGYTVVGCALAGVAAQGLEEGSGIPSTTIKASLMKWEAEPGREPRDPLPEDSIIVIDEAGMVGTDDMQRLVRVAEQYRAKIVFVGDYEQLQAIERGAAFRGIVERIGSVEITEIRRQKVEWQREASIELATEKTKAALARYDDAGFTHDSATMADAKKALAEKWFADHVALPTSRNEKGELTNTQIMLAYRNADVQALNQAAREFRKEANELGPDVDVTFTTRADPQGGGTLSERKIAVGDRLYFLKNNRDLNGVAVMNGSLGTITAIADSPVARQRDPKLTVDLDNGKKVTFKLSEYNNLELGYAGTVNKAQGVTVDRAYALASSQWDRHLSYVALTRHRTEMNLYWSRDQFRDKNQRDRVLSKRGLKDNALDFEIDRPKELAPTYLRTPKQVQREFNEALRTAKHLAEIALPEQREAADAALAATRSWYRDVTRGVEKLQEAGVTTIAIDRHNASVENLNEHLGKLQAGVEREVEGLLAKQHAALEQAKIEERAVEPEVPKMDAPAASPAPVASRVERIAAAWAEIALQTGQKYLASLAVVNGADYSLDGTGGEDHAFAVKSAQEEFEVALKAECARNEALASVAPAALEGAQRALVGATMESDFGAQKLSALARNGERLAFVPGSGALSAERRLEMVATRYQAEWRQNQIGSGKRQEATRAELERASDADLLDGFVRNGHWFNEGVAEKAEAPGIAPEVEVNVKALTIVDASSITRAAEKMLDSDSYLNRVAGVITLTGRRPVEILKTGEFQLGLGANEIIFSGQAKTRDSEKALAGFEIPALAQRDKVLATIAQLREELSVPNRHTEKPVSELDASQINDRVGKGLRAIMQREFGMKPQEMRAAYAEIARTRFAPQRGAFPYYAQVLGHNVLDDKTSLSYAKYAVKGQESATLVGLERGRREALDLAHEQLREARDDKTRGYAQEKIARLMAARFMLQTSAKQSEIALQPISAEATIVRAERLLRSDRYADVAAGVMVLTGRSVTEVMRSASFQVDPNDRSRLLVRTSPSGPASSVYCLAPPQRVIDGLKKIREQREFSRLSDREVLARVREQMQASIAGGFGAGSTSRDVRGMYAAIAFSRERPSGGVVEYTARVLGVDAQRAAHSYGRFFVGDAEKAQERLLRSMSEQKEALERRAAQERDPALRDAYLRQAEGLSTPTIHIRTGQSIEYDVQELRDLLRRERTDIDRRIAGQRSTEGLSEAPDVQRRRLQQRVAIEQEEEGFDIAKEHAAHGAAVARSFAEDDREIASEHRAELLGRREGLVELEGALEATLRQSPSARLHAPIGRDSMIDLDAVRQNLQSVDLDLSRVAEIAKVGAELSL
jgi:Ti-type conjugative transfer relaxase TraA